MPMVTASSLMRSGMPALTNTDQKTTVPSTVTSALTRLKPSDTLRTVQGSILRTTRRTRWTGMFTWLIGDAGQCTGGPPSRTAFPPGPPRRGASGLVVLFRWHPRERGHMGARGQGHYLDPGGGALLAEVGK